MAVEVGVNSWITVSEADDYLENNMDSEEWFELVESGKKGSMDKSNILVTAYRELMSSQLVEISADNTDINVKNAQAEMAIFLLKYYTEIFDRRASIASGLSSLTSSKIKEEFDTSEGGGTATIPGNVLGLLVQYNTGNTTVSLEAY